MRRAGGRRRGGAVFLAPGLVAAASSFGLVASLAGDGAWDWIGAAALLVPALAAATGGRLPKRRGPVPPPVSAARAEPPARA